MPNRYDPLWTGKVEPNPEESAKGSAHDAFWESPRVHGNTAKAFSNTKKAADA